MILYMESKRGMKAVAVAPSKSGQAPACVSEEKVGVEALAAHA